MNKEKRKPTFRLGDVVECMNNQYFIKEAINIVNNDRLSGYMYDVSMIDSPTVTYTFQEDSLIFLYHDKQWEEYVIESLGNGLPAWRGELYNLYELYFDFFDQFWGFKNYAKDYYHDTIPPLSMERILNRHTIYGRIDDVLASDKNAKTIMLELKADKYSMWDDVLLLERRIEKRNGIEYTKTTRFNVNKFNLAKLNFTSNEITIAQQIDLLDTEMRNGKEQHVEHFKLELRNIDIMRMIQQAYKSARKISRREVNQTSTDRRTGVATKQNPGKAEYEGITKDDTVIRFIYDFDIDAIDTAYPVRMNDNAKKQK